MSHLPPVAQSLGFQVYLANIVVNCVDDKVDKIVVWSIVDLDGIPVCVPGLTLHEKHLIGETDIVCHFIFILQLQTNLL